MMLTLLNSRTLSSAKMRFRLENISVLQFVVVTTAISYLFYMSSAALCFFLNCIAQYKT